MALTKTGAALKGYGNSYSETIGLITAGTEMLPNQASKVARGWRTIGANVLKLAQSEDTLSAANGKVNISLRDSQGNMKSTFAVLQDLHKGIEGQSVAWKDLSQEEQSSISLMLAGKTQTEVFKSTMDNFSQAIAANEKALDSQGSAARENAKYLDSIQGKLQSFRSAWQQLSYHLVDSATIKAVLGFATTLIKALDKIVEAVDKLPKPLSTVIGLLTAFGTVVGGLKLLNFAEGFTAIGKAAKNLTGAVEGVGEAASVASGAKGLGSLTSAIGLLTNPAVLGSIAAIGVAIAAIKIDKYFSFEESLKRLNEYEDKLKTVTNEIETLKKKRSSDEGLTDAEETHLAVLEAEERSLQRQIELENQRVKKAFDRDIGKHGHMEQGEFIVDSSGPKQLSSYNNALDAQITKYKEIQKLTKGIKELKSDAEEDGIISPEEEKLLARADTQLQNMYDDYGQLKARTAEYGAELAAYYEEVKNAIPYEKMTADERKAFDEMHRGVLTNKIAVDSLTGSYTQFVNTLNSLIDVNGFDGLINFDDIDIGSLKSAEELIAAVKQQLMGLDDNAEIKIEAKDETGEVIGNIEGKKADFTEEAWDIILKAQTTGDWDKVQEYLEEHPEVEFKFTESGASEVSEKKDEITEPSEAEIKVRQEGLEEFMANKRDAMTPGTAPINVTDQGSAGQTQGEINSIKGHDVKIPINQGGEKTSGIQGSINGVKGKDVHINIFKTIWESIKKKAKGKRKGEEGGMAWLGDEGSRSNPKPELVVGEDGAYLAGTEGWEMRNLKSSDTVYTYAQTKRLLSGNQTFSGVASELPRFKKGKKAKKKKATKSTPATNANVDKAQAKVSKAKSKKAKKKAKKALEKLQKQRENIRNEFDSRVAQLKHSAKVNHWTDAQYQAEYTKLYNQYNAYLSGDQSDTYTEDHDEYLDTLAKDESERLIGLVGVGGMSAASAVSSINANAHLTADEKQDYRAKAYQESVEYNLKEYKNGKATRSQILADIQNYYNTRGKYDEEYYKMLNELREADKEKEIDRLKELQKTQENRLSLAEKYIKKELDSVKKQIDADKEELELEKDLVQAKNKRIRIYREGQGFVYEEDVEAIQEAQKALEKTPLEQRAEELQAILDLFDEMADNSAIKELEVLLGVSGVSGVTGGLTTNSSLDAWTNWIKNAYASSTGYADLIEKLEKIGTSDINSWLTANGGLNVSNSLISQYINKHSFASGTLNSPSGFSLVGENGPELRYLKSGSVIFSNVISKNLMEWGRYSPAQVLNSNASAQTQVFNFDKIVLPNVSNAKEFYRELQRLPNKALQQSTRRI